MYLIAILLAMGTEGFWKSLGVLGHFKFLVRYGCWLHERFAGAVWFNGALGVLLALAPGVLAVGAAQAALARWPGLAAWIVALVFATVVLVFCIGVRGLNKHVENYLGALARGDAEGAYLYVSEFLRRDAPRDPLHMNRLLLEAILVRNNERLLAILFWFVLLGPVGAVLYRSTSQLKGMAQVSDAVSPDLLEAILRLQAILDWIPARLTGLSYALIGSFVDALHYWRSQAPTWRGDLRAGNRGALVASGLGALRFDSLAEEVEVDQEALREQVLDAQALVRRTVIAWLAVFGLLTIAGWLS